MPTQPTALESSTGSIVWFTGLSGSGKTTLCRCVAQELAARGRVHFVIDGDETRKTICRDLGFSRPDREENMRRLAALAATHALAGEIVLVAAIAPYRSVRQQLRRASLVPFFEVFVDATLAVCEARDPKGLYRRARAGAIEQFTGIDDIYEPPEPPEPPDIHCRTGEETVAESCSKVIAALSLPAQLPAAGPAPAANAPH